MGSPGVLQGLRKCIEYLKTMPEEEASRISEDYRKFSEQYDSEEEILEEVRRWDVQVRLSYEIDEADGAGWLETDLPNAHGIPIPSGNLSFFTETLAA